MKRFLASAGVDYEQWRVLTRTFVKLDFGPLWRNLRGDDGLATAARTIVGVSFLVLLMGSFGALPAYVLWTNDDLWLGGAVLATQFMSITAAFLLVNHAAALVSPQDHGILGFRPVSSRTYFAVRLTTLFAHTLPPATMMAVLPLLALTVRPDASFSIVAAGIAVIYASVMATTLALAAGYGWLLTIAGPRRFAVLLNYVQILASLVTFSGLILIGDEDARQYFHSGTLPRTGWALLFPGVWLGSYLELAGGEIGLLEITAAGASVLAFLALARALGGKLSLEYAGRLAGLLNAAATPATRSVWVPRVFRDETRATAILVRSQFKNDIRFRMGVLAILPITLVYFFIGWRSGDVPGDPFLGDRGNAGSTMLVQMAVFFLPDMLRQSLVMSDAYRASWVFHTTGADLTRLVMSSQIVIAALFILPYAGLLAIAFAFMWAHPGHALVHALFLAWMSYLVLQLSVLVDPRLPFSGPVVAQAGFGSGVGRRFVVMIGGTFVYIFMTLVIYRRPWLVMIAAIALLGTSLALNRLTRVRVEARASTLRYET